jgi:cell division septation protein DedD
MGIMAKELESQQMVSLLQAIPKDSPAFNVILISVFQNSSMHNRDQVVQALMEGMQPDEQKEEMDRMHMELQMQQAQADIQKTMAEAQEEQTKAMKNAAEAGAAQPNELKIQEKFLKLQKDLAAIDKLRADTENVHSETMRNIPEIEHLKSETLLNIATATEKLQG